MLLVKTDDSGIRHHHPSSVLAETSTRVPGSSTRPPSLEQVPAGHETYETTRLIAGQQGANKFLQVAHLATCAGGAGGAVGHRQQECCTTARRQESVAAREQRRPSAQDQLDSAGCLDAGRGDETQEVQAARESRLSTEEVLEREFRVAVAYSLDEFKKYSCRR